MVVVDYENGRGWWKYRGLKPESPGSRVLLPLTTVDLISPLEVWEGDS